MTTPTHRAHHQVRPHGPPCPRCLATTWRSLKQKGFDTFFCLGCDQWLEPACGEADCYYCHDRPARPSEAVAEFERGEWLLPA